MLSFDRAFGAVSATALALMACCAMVVTRAHAEGMPRATRLRAMDSVVKLRVMVRRAGKLVEAGHGSGSVISADGLILTNNHVVQNTRTGQLYDAIAVAPNRGFDQAPKSVCLAFPKRAVRHATLDLAIIKCEARLDGQPLRRKLSWSPVNLGDSSTLIPGDELFVVGFPAIGGSTITFTSGKVSGFLADRRMGPGRAWIKTDALISGGVSGGAAFDAAGKLVGVPTAYRRGKRGHTNIGMVRVVQKAKPLLAMAQSRPWGRLPRVAQVMPPTGEDGPRFRYQEPPRDAKPLPSKLPPMGEGPPMAEGPSTAPPSGAPGGRDGGDRAEEPRTAGPKPGPRGSGTSALRPGSGYSAVAGRVVEQGSSAPVQGAIVVLLKAGVDAFRVNPKALRRQVATAGVADGRGFFVGRSAVRQGGTHSLIIVARGFVPLRVNNAVQLMIGSPPRFNLGLIRLRRRGRPTATPRQLPQFEEVPE